MNDDDTLRINPGYPLTQLLRALSGTGDHASVRADQWRQVLTGLFDGTLRIGPRTPVEHTPPWVTLEVVHGGFATGNAAAAGPLQPHESQKLRSIPQPGRATDRAALNIYFLSDLGRPELATMLANGCFRVQVPEEGALLIAAWLLGHGEPERAAGLIEALMPFFDRLRFYPTPHPRPARSGTGVYVQTVGEAIKVLRAKRPQPSVARMNEAIQNLGTPLYAYRAVGLFLEMIEGEIPSFRAIESGELLRGPSGQPIIAGGWPCRHYPSDWAARAQQLLVEYQAARAQHQLCGKPEKPKENFARLRSYLATCIDEPRSLTGRDVGMIRKILASYVTRQGAPASQRLQRTRAMQGHMAARPMHHVLARVLADRMQECPEDEGAPDLPTLLGPLSTDEASRIEALPGEQLPPAVVAKAMRCLAAPLEELIERRIVPSSEVMAAVLPLLTARIHVSAIADPQLGRVYEAVYRAFRRRRSLLLLDLQSQVRLEELPWIAAVEPWVGSDQASHHAARATLVQAATLAITAFPHTILPNTLIKEFQTLVSGAGISLPLVEELAADIFMGAFAAKFLRAAQLAGRVLRGSLYERYYGIHYDLILGLNDVEQHRFGAPTSPGFARVCEALARADPSRSRSVARNGTIIEQAAILTTHNLAVLFNGLDLATLLRPRFAQLARECFEWICQQQQLQIREWHAQLKMIKNTAYAWRQMLFYLSLVNQAELGDFLEWGSSFLHEQQGEFVHRFRPVMLGLTAIASGEQFDAEGNHSLSGGRRFVGWTVGRHWLLAQGS